MYVLGYAASFTDSVAYITQIQLLDTVTIDAKTKFLMDRNLYSIQLQHHISETFHHEDIFTAIFYNTKKSKLDKKAAKIREKISKERYLRITDTDYRFHCEEWIAPEIISTDEKGSETDNGKKYKEGRKSKKNRKKN